MNNKSFINKNSFLTIIIPTYKRPDKLGLLLSILAKQKNISFDEFEIMVSDNCSGDSTKEVVESYKMKLPNLKYSCHPNNIGSERNIYSLYCNASGDYIWLIPDDDQVNGEYAVSSAVEKIKNCVSPPSFVILNAKIVDVNTNALIKERINSITGDIFLSDGHDILNFITDFDLIGAQRIIIRKDVLTDLFITNYMKNPDHLIPMVCSLVASAKGPALVIGDTLAVFGDNDPTPWRVYWPYIALQLMPELMLTAVNELGYSDELVKKIIARRKYENFNSIIRFRNSHFLVFQMYSLSWPRLAKLYGWPFVLCRVVIGLPMAIIRVIIPLRFAKFMLSILR